MSLHHAAQHVAAHGRGPDTTLVHMSKDVLAHEWDAKHITELLIQIFDAIIHEFKHQRQSRKRNFKIFWHNA